jgi:hypothetical protein
MEEYINVEDFCAGHNIELSFISSIYDMGLIEVNWIEQRRMIPANELDRLERIVHFHNDLDINPEGIETVLHLLDRMNEMNEEIRVLKNRLGLYE